MDEILTGKIRSCSKEGVHGKHFILTHQQPSQQNQMVQSYEPNHSVPKHTVLGQLHKLRVSITMTQSISQSRIFHILLTEHGTLSPAPTPLNYSQYYNQIISDNHERVCAITLFLIVSIKGHHLLHQDLVSKHIIFIYLHSYTQRLLSQYK